jgi:hypothetical protein
MREANLFYLPFFLMSHKLCLVRMKIFVPWSCPLQVILVRGVFENSQIQFPFSMQIDKLRVKCSNDLITRRLGFGLCATTNTILEKFFTCKMIQARVSYFISQISPRGPGKTVSRFNTSSLLKLDRSNYQDFALAILHKTEN